VVIQENLAAVCNELDTQRHESVEVSKQLAETSENLSRTKNDLEETRRTNQVRFMQSLHFRFKNVWRFMDYFLVLSAS